MAPDVGVPVPLDEHGRLIHTLSILVAKLEERVSSSFEHMRESFDHFATSLDKIDNRLTTGDAALEARVGKIEAAMQYAKGAAWACGVIGMGVGWMIAKLWR